MNEIAKNPQKTTFSHGFYRSHKDTRYLMVEHRESRIKYPLKSYKFSSEVKWG